MAEIMAPNPEDKVARALLTGELPPYVRRGADRVGVAIRYAGNASPAIVAQELARLGLRDVKVDEYFRTAYAAMPPDAALRVAALPWVLSVCHQPVPAESYNYQGRILGRACVLNTSPSLGGRGLLGKGVRIGIWDSNVTPHVDFGQRVHLQEYEAEGDHGIHVTGTVLGAGIKDPDAQGMAPLAQSWNYNFNVQKNGYTPQREMADAHRQVDIHR